MCAPDTIGINKMNPVLNRRGGNPWHYIILPVVILNLATLLTLAIYSIVTSQPFTIYGTGGQQPLFWMYLISALSMWGLALFAIVKLKREGSSISKLIAPGGNPLKLKWQSALVLLLFIILLYAVQIAFSVLFTGPRVPHDDLMGWQRLALVTFLPISFGYTEELFWRGFVVTRLRTNGISSPGSVLFSALAFSFARGIIFPGGIVLAFLLGSATAVYYIRERNLLPLMFGHALADAMWLGFSFFAI
jgi:membrane protease YdiL (CAAX protease family)